METSETIYLDGQGKTLEVGDRVEIPAWADEWMMGDRYGEVMAIRDPDWMPVDGTARASVMLDKSSRRRSYFVKDLRRI